MMEFLSFMHAVTETGPEQAKIFLLYCAVAGAVLGALWTSLKYVRVKNPGRHLPAAMVQSRGRVTIWALMLVPPSLVVAAFLRWAVAESVVDVFIGPSILVGGSLVWVVAALVFLLLHFPMSWSCDLR